MIEFSTFDEAIEIANGVEYSLAGSVWTNDLRNGIKASNALRLKAGNGFTVPSTLREYLERFPDDIRAYAEVRPLNLALSQSTKPPMRVCRRTSSSGSFNFPIWASRILSRCT